MADSQDKQPKTIDAQEFYKTHPRPIVLHFQPKAYRVLHEPEDLRRWETSLREEVGLKNLDVKVIAGGVCDTITYDNTADACDID